MEELPVLLPLLRRVLPAHTGSGSHHGSAELHPAFDHRWINDPVYCPLDVVRCGARRQCDGVEAQANLGVMCAGEAVQFVEQCDV